MAELNIYLPTDGLFPKLVDSITAKGYNLIVLCKDSKEMVYLDEYLWSFKQLSFIPHCTEDDSLPLEHQKVFLTVKEQNPINAKCLVLRHDIVGNISFIEQFNKILYTPEQDELPNNLIDAFKKRTGGQTYLIKQDGKGSWQKQPYE